MASPTHPELVAHGCSSPRAGALARVAQLAVNNYANATVPSNIYRKDDTCTKSAAFRCRGAHKYTSLGGLWGLSRAQVVDISEKQIAEQAPRKCRKLAKNPQKI